MRANKTIVNVLSRVFVLAIMLHTSVLLAKEFDTKRQSDAEWLSGGSRIDKSWDDHKYSGTDWSKDNFSYRDLYGKEAGKPARVSKKSEQSTLDDWEWTREERPKTQRTEKIVTRDDWSSSKFVDRNREKDWRRERTIRETTRIRPSDDKYRPTTIRRHYPAHSTVRYICYHCNCFYPHCHCLSPCWVVYRPYVIYRPYYPRYVADHFSINLNYWDRHGWGFGFFWSGK